MGSVIRESELLERPVEKTDGTPGIARLYDEHAGSVHRFLVGLRLGLDAAAVEDAVQETFLRLLRLLRASGGFPNYDAGRPLGPYILGVARHVALDFCRRRRPLPLDDPPSRESSSDDALLGVERRELVARALGALEPDLRAALVLRHMNGLSMENLAMALDCSIPTARARVESAGHLFAVALRRLGLDRKELS